MAVSGNFCPVHIYKLPVGVFLGLRQVGEELASMVMFA